MSSNLRIRQAVSLAVSTAGAAAATMGFSPLAVAVEATGPDASAAPDTTLQEVVVTGSRIRRVVVDRRARRLIDADCDVPDRRLQRGALRTCIFRTGKSPIELVAKPRERCP